MARQGYTVLATLLTSTEAGMARGLLVSAGIDAFVEDEAVTAVLPPLQLAVGGAKLLVADPDAEVARDLLRDKGLLSGPAEVRGEPVEIPEAEWSAGPAPEQGAEVIPLPGAGDRLAERMVRRALAAAIAGLLVPIGLLQIYSLWLIVRSMGQPGKLRPASGWRVALAVVLDVGVLAGLWLAARRWLRV